MTQRHERTLHPGTPFRALGRWLAILTLMAQLGCGASGPSPVDGGPHEDAATTDAGVDANAPDDAGNPDVGADAGSCDPITPPEPDEPDLEALCGSAPTTLEEWEQCYLRRLCEWRMACFDRVVYRDLSECMDTAEAASPRLTLERRQRERAVAQGKATIDEEAFAQCLHELGPSPCIPLAPQFRASCRLRLQGAVQDGGACFADVECASPGAGCVQDDDCAGACCEGVCEPALPEGAEDCRRIISGDPPQTCQPGLQCVSGTPRCDDGVWCCVADTGVGAPCRNRLDCRVGTWCDPECGVCRAPLPEGAECTERRQCGDQTECVGLSITHGDPGVCTRVDEAEAECDIACRGPLYCGPQSDPNSERSCHPLVELGETCPFGVPDCRGVANTCSGSECVPRTPDGEPCGTGLPECMPGSFCDASLDPDNPVCTPLQDEGAPCTVPWRCASYLCSGDSDDPGECLPWLDTCPDTE